VAIYGNTRLLSALEIQYIRETSTFQDSLILKEVGVGPEKEKWIGAES
jgi:hypothetical protein